MFKNTCLKETNPAIFIVIFLKELTALQIKNQAKKDKLWY